MFQVPAHAGDIDVELDLVSVGIRDVEAVGDGVVARADDVDARFLATPYRIAQLVVRVAHLETEVIQADMAATRQVLRVLTDLDEQELVVRAPAAEERDRDAAERAVRGLETLPAEHIPVERRGSLDVVDVQDDMAEFLDLHGVKLTQSPLSKTGAHRRRAV